MEEFHRLASAANRGFCCRGSCSIFCKAPIPVPTATEIQQLSEVVKFRSQLASQDLTVSHPFVAHHAAVALLDAVINLPAENCAGLRDALARARELALRLKGDPDRLTVPRRADPELEQKCVKIHIGALALRPQGNRPRRLRTIKR
jgi:hypothetical protein